MQSDAAAVGGWMNEHSVFPDDQFCFMKRGVIIRTFLYISRGGQDHPAKFQFGMSFNVTASRVNR